MVATAHYVIACDASIQHGYQIESQLLSANKLGESSKDGLRSWGPAPMQESWMKFPIPCSSLDYSGHCRHL